MLCLSRNGTGSKLIKSRPREGGFHSRYQTSARSWFVEPVTIGGLRPNILRRLARLSVAALLWRGVRAPSLIRAVDVIIPLTHT